MNNFDSEKPDETTVWLRRRLMQQIRSTPDPIHQALMDLERLGEPYLLETMLDYDPDTTDVDERPF